MKIEIGEKIRELRRRDGIMNGCITMRKTIDGMIMTGKEKMNIG